MIRAIKKWPQHIAKIAHLQNPKIDPSGDSTPTIKTTRHTRESIKAIRHARRFASTASTRSRQSCRVHLTAETRPHLRSAPLRADAQPQQLRPHQPLSSQKLPPSAPRCSTLMQLEGDRVGIYSARGLRLDKGFGQVN